MSTSVTGSGAGSPWSCRACGHSNTFAVTHLASTVSVPCHQCGAFQSVARPATATHYHHPTKKDATSPKPATNGTAATASPISPATSSSIPIVHTRAPLSLTDTSSLDRFRSFLRLRTVANEGTTNGANEQAVQFLKEIGENVGMKATVLEYAPHRPILILTLQGKDPSLPSILLNSHYDVVPVMRDQWKCDPFEAMLEEETGKIYGRGTQDMKCICMAYLESLLRLIRGSSTGTSPFLRTVHLSFQPDEETGGEWGMAKWVETSEFRALNVGFALDEGIANPEDAYTVFYGERGVWWMTVTATGPTGHASRFIQNPATQKLHRTITKFLEYRDLQEAKLLAGHSGHGAECAHALSKKLELGDVITVNLTVLKAGVSVDGGSTYSMNVVPMEASAGFDIRLPPHVPLEDFEAMVKEWTSGDEGVTYTVRKFSAEFVTQIDSQRNPFWRTFRGTLEKFGEGTTKVEPQIFPAGTDSRFLRKAGIPVIGFSPLRKTPVLLHDHNEFIHKDIYLECIRVYQDLVPALANQVEGYEVESGEGGVYKEPKQRLDRVEDRKQPEQHAPAANHDETKGAAPAPVPAALSAESAAAKEIEA